MQALNRFHVICLEVRRLRYLPESSCAVHFVAALGSWPMNLSNALAKPSFNGILQRHVLGVALSVTISAFGDNGFGPSTAWLHLGLLNVLEEDFDEQNKFVTISIVMAASTIIGRCLARIVQERCNGMLWRRGHGHVFDTVCCCCWYWWDCRLNDEVYVFNDDSPRRRGRAEFVF